MRKFNIFLVTAISILTTTSFAADKAASTQARPNAAHLEKANASSLKEPTEFQKVINEYKEYVAKIGPEVREEVIAYRKEVARINKEKRALYKKLSQASQDYLKKEQEYKKQLPVGRKSLINVENPGEKLTK